MATCYDINTYKDFEIIWFDKITHQVKDMNNVTFELYHYDEAHAPEIIVPNKEPYVISECSSSRLNIGSVETNLGIIIDVEVVIDFNIIANNLADLGCPPNDYVVCGTGNKISIANGCRVAALSACELAALINLGTSSVGASGYHAESLDGFLVLIGDYPGSTAYLEVGNGNINNVLGIVQGDQYFGYDTRLVYDITPQPTERISTGRYVYLNVGLYQPHYTLEERYFAIFKGIDPTTLLLEMYEEDFALVEGKTVDFNYSFTI